MAISYSDFERVEIRVGKIVKVEDFPEARNPSFKLEIDFGSDIGIKKSSAQITVNYKKEELLGRQVLAVVNFAPKKIAGFSSEVLVLGFDDGKGGIVLVMPERHVPLGGKLY